MFSGIVAVSTTVTLTLAVGFMVVLALVLLVPWIIDLVKSENRAPAGEAPKGMSGLSRTSMALAVLVVVAFALSYVLVANPFGTQAGSKIVGDIVVALTTTLAAITAFYFGSKTKEEATATESDISKSVPMITVTRPIEGHAYHVGEHVGADFFASGKFARLETDPPLVNGEVDTTAARHGRLTVRAKDCSGHDLGASKTVEYEVVA